MAGVCSLNDPSNFLTEFEFVVGGDEGGERPMTMLVILGAVVGAAGLAAVLVQTRRARKNAGPIQLGVGTKILPVGSSNKRR